MSPLPEVITSTKRAKKVVSKLLLTESPIAAVGVVFKANQLTGDISVIALHSPSLSRSVVFDVYRNPKLYLEGELHRVFQAERLVKVVHDCKKFCTQLKSKQLVTCNAMFDTQVSYTLEMEQNGLPPRLISYDCLHRNIVGFDIGELYAYVKGLERNDGNLWNKRPIPDELLYAISEEVISLRNDVYPKILSSIDENKLDEFELRCASAAKGRRRIVKSATSKRPPTRPPVMSLSTRQAHLLVNTRPI